MSLTSVYVFLLGLASGITLLTITSYRRVSPPWLKRLLVVAGLLVMSRYLTMVLFTSHEAPERFWALRHCWFATSIGLMVPSVFAVDQLLRDPRMSPKRLLIWCSPFLIAYGLVMLFGGMTPMPDRVAGWTPRLSPGWQALLSLTTGTFLVGFIGMCAVLVRKIPSHRLQLALLGLAAGQGALGFDGLLLAFGGWYFRPFLYTEMATLLAIWHAYETSAALQQGS